VRGHLRWLCFATLLCAHTAFADDGWTPYPARLSLQLGIGSQSQMLGDAFFPVWGDLHRFGYLAFNGQLSSNTSWSGSLGIGGRQNFANRIVGAYLYADRDMTPDFGSDKTWWVLNPGVEMIANQNDVRINFFAPVGTNEQHSGRSLVAIPYGVELDAGFQAPQFYDSRVHAGAYFFQFSPSGDYRNIYGLETGIGIPLRYLVLQGDVSYDTVNGVASFISVRFDFGGAMPVTVYFPLEERMIDLVRRHLSTLYTSSAIPVERR
jgi:hypothetical protein